ncbi:multidrug resistance protein, MATE family [Schistosoma bovis]|uniref:Multidrug and toxin extrusion protein n=1 Tax=Schistosoma bovis TaxID=6184 RepID=A0A430QNC2_SCHBO|nr:multidrug resistance protein, MATE family [Schistosoma bovis]
MISQLLRFTNPSISVMVCGHLSREELDASSLANCIINIFGLSIDTGFSSACDTLFSQAYGSRNRELIGTLLQRALCVVCLMYMTLVCIHLNIETVLLLLGQNPLTASLTSEYIAYFLPGLGFDFLFLTFARYLQTQNIIQPIVYSTFTGTVFNMFAQYYFIVHLNYGLRTGYDLLEFLGCKGLGAVQEIIKVPLGLFTAVNIRVGQRLGAFDPVGARYVYFTALTIISIVALFTGLPVVLLRHYIPYMFTSDEEVCSLASQLLPMLLLFQFLEGFAGVSEAILLACGRQSLGAITIFLGYYCTGMPIAAILTYQTSLGILGSWIGLTIGFGLTTMVYTILALRTDWTKQVKQARNNVTEISSVYSTNNINEQYKYHCLDIKNESADASNLTLFEQSTMITENLSQYHKMKFSKNIKCIELTSNYLWFKCIIFFIFLILLIISLYIRFFYSIPLWYTYCNEQVNSLDKSSFCIRIMPINNYLLQSNNNITHLLMDNMTL